jgi:hypothetical protein
LTRCIRMQRSRVAGRRENGFVARGMSGAPSHRPLGTDALSGLICGQATVSLVVAVRQPTRHVVRNLYSGAVYFFFVAIFSTKSLRGEKFSSGACQNF